MPTTQAGQAPGKIPEQSADNALDFMRLVLATFAAVLVQPLLAIAYTFGPFLVIREELPYSQLPGFAGSVTLVGAVFVVALGIPTYYFLRRFGIATKQRVALAGCALSAVPASILGWPRRSTGFSSGGNWHGTYVEFYSDGVPTLYAWLTYFESVLWFGLHGFLGALVFYLLISKSSERSLG